MALDGLTLREGRGEADCGLPAAAAAPLRGRFHSDTGEPGRQRPDVAFNYLVELRRFEEAKALLRKTIPVARRFLGESDDITLRMRAIYAQSFYMDPGVTLDDLREAVTRLEDAERTARRVLGSAHPVAGSIEAALQASRATLCARETLRPGEF